MRIFGKGFNFSQDGPGNRLVYHLSGCNMRCIWCSNPECFNFEAGKFYSSDEIVDECLRSTPMFFSGGGVTFTGGEATLQLDELFTILQKLKNSGIHTCIETNGTCERMSDILELIDYLIMDFKHYDSELLKKYTNIGNETVKKNYENICKQKRQLHIRIPLINEFNTQCPERFAEYFANYNTENTAFEFLPYHEYGKDKWTTEYKVKNGFISNEILETFISTFKRYNLKIVNT